MPLDALWPFTRVGDGFHVYPVFANKAFTQEMSPFLMFDYAAPKNFPPTKKRLGVGEHPHRGFETVTIAFQGEVEHKDSTGNCGIMGPGDVQVICFFSPAGTRMLACTALISPDCGAS